MLLLLLGRCALVLWRPPARPPTRTPSPAQALVEVASLEDAQKACTLDREIFLPKYGDRYVRVLLVEDLTPADLRAGDGAVLAAKASAAARRWRWRCCWFGGGGEAARVAVAGSRPRARAVVLPLPSPGCRGPHLRPPPRPRPLSPLATPSQPAHQPPPAAGPPSLLQASRSGRRSNGEAETVAKVCGLPPGITLAELLQLFWGLQAKPGSTHITGENGSCVEVGSGDGVEGGRWLGGGGGRVVPWEGMGQQVSWW